jgi:transposase
VEPAGSVWSLLGWISAHPESLLGSAVLVWALSQIAATATARAEQRRRLRHAAVALRTEIELIRENLEQFIPGYAELTDRLREDPARRFFMLANKRSQQTLDSLRADLVTMPGDVLKAVIAFYTLDAEINQFLETLMQPTFLDLPVEQRIEILEVYADLFDSAVARARSAEAELRLLAWASSPWWSDGRRRYRATLRQRAALSRPAA